MHRLHARVRSLLALTTGLFVACSDDDGGQAASVDAATGTHDSAAQVETDAGLPPVVPTTTALTYWQDMLPLFESHCLQCHQPGGIAPFRLDDYAEVKQKAALIGHSTKSRRMPPWDITSDGTCGEFQHSLALSDDEIARVAAWVEAGAPEGTPAAVRLPPVDTLPSATEFPTPLYVPEIQGGMLAEADDYRCFELDAGTDALRFITGYDVQPGTPEIVHHVVVSLVDPEAPAEAPAMAGTTNRQVMDALDAESPDRLGWPCYGLAGDGVSVSSVPVVWAPGQGVVSFPGNSGVPLSPTQKVIVQVHYNLSDASQRGKSDATRVRLRLAPSVENVGIFALPDALLESLQTEKPEQLAPGQPSLLYTWKKSMSELGLDELPELKLWGVMPHMHQRGRKYQMRIKSGDTPAQCAADVQRWDFHWQRMYFYTQPWSLSASSEIEVTCDFDTADASSPVLPGWGTRNEMCLATLYLTVPAKVAGF